METLRNASPERYADLGVVFDESNENSGIAFDHASDIYAQVGLWLKSADIPLPGVEWLHMTGHSMSVGPVWQYMDSHHDRYRLDDGAPIYDGFFPETTRTASRMGPFPEVDVPTILINPELEVEEVLVQDGIDYRRPDSDEPGDEDLAIVRDDHGNAVGGVRSITLDVPAATHLALNETVDAEADLTPGSCLVYGSQIDFSTQKLATFYGDSSSYLAQVDEHLDELIEQGWVLDQFADELRLRAQDAAGSLPA